MTATDCFREKMPRTNSSYQMTEITNFLYLSGVSAVSPEKLKRKRITCVVNATVEQPNLYVPGMVEEVSFISWNSSCYLSSSPFIRVNHFTRLHCPIQTRSANWLVRWKIS